MPIREQVSTVSITIDKEGEKPPVLYTANINSKTIFCGGMINGMEQLDNLSSDSGTFSSGFNATAFLQPGENELNLWTVPVGAYNGDFTYCSGQLNLATALESAQNRRSDSFGLNPAL
ncbi:glycosyl hydrolase family 26 [Vibrio cholerae]|nr:glycosyl hydrolase family 26 [Vibrio cholerae]GIA49865.1 glycosyl hydrolase family 26 [Vibrio cholerae]